MIELSIRKPVAVTVGVLLVILFGTLSLGRVPIQLTPDVTNPQITVDTVWQGASPYEIEREIVDEQEEQLKGVEGVDRITSESQDSLGRIILEFPPGTDLDASLIRVSNRLEQVPEYPDDADKPVISTTNNTDNAMAWFMLRRLEGNDTPIDNYFRLAEDYVKPRFERVKGVASSNVFGGREEELQVRVRPADLAARGITIPELVAAIDRENQNRSAGEYDLGKRSFKVRTVGEYVTPEDVENIVVKTVDGGRVYLRDVADVREGMKRRVGFVRQKSVPTIAINCIRQSGANVLDTMAGIRAAVGELNRGILAERNLELSQVYDETEYITESIDRVVQNLLLGSSLAIIVLFLFLRSVASTFIIAVSIPISIVGSFILLLAFGRSVNVISLAGMSFASGMVVDNAIVSLENIYRLRQEGKSRFDAALEGAREVWGAILSSTLTTIAVFLPILFVEEKAGQLFRDIAIAISCSVGLSLIVSVSVIPTLSAKLLRGRAPVRAAAKASLFDRFRERLVGAVDFALGGWVRRLAVILLLGGVSTGLAFWLVPDAEYLPTGNRNLAIGVLLPPPGYSLDTLEEVGRTVEKRLEPYVAPDEDGAEGGDGKVARAAAADEAGGVVDPLIKHVFFVVRGTSVFLGASATEADRAGELVEVIRGSVADLPGFIDVAQQASLFDRGVESGRSVDIEISGPDLERLVEIGGMIFGDVMRLFPFAEGNQARPVPSLDLQTPEVHIIPDREKARDLGLTTQEIGLIVDAIIDGAKASEYKITGKEVDLSVIGSDREREWRPEELADLPIATPDGQLVTLGTAATVVETRGPQQINHIERDRAITIKVLPADGIALESAVRTIREQIVDRLEADGIVAAPYRIELAGTVDDLAQAYSAFEINFALAILITYLLLSALFENFAYPFIVMGSVPLAAVGGLLCLALVHAFAPEVKLDILTMLGFVILVGVVVNNAILIVYQALAGLRAGAAPREAITEAVRSRVRPIFMTTMTSGIGMLPLVVFPGAGSELYRGLGSVVVGGLVVSTVFTLFLIPCLLSIVFDIQVALAGRQSAEAES